MTLIGSFGLFFTLFLAFIRVLPAISIGEVKSVLGFARKKAPPAKQAAAPTPPTVQEVA